MGTLLRFFTVFCFFIPLVQAGEKPPSKDHYPSGSIADINRAKMNPQTRMTEILSRRNKDGEPGEKLASFQGRLSDAVMKAKDGKPEDLHDVLDAAKGGDLSSTECGDVDYLIQNHFLKDEASPKVKEILDLRKVPSRELYAGYSTGGPERQTEWWRRVRSLVRSSGGLFTETQMNHFLSTYYSVKEEDERTAGKRAMLIGPLLTNGIDPAALKLFSGSLAESTAFPCGDSVTSDLFIAVEMLANPRRRLPERTDWSLFRKMAELEDQPFGKMFRKYLETFPPDRDDPVMAIERDVPNGSPYDEAVARDERRKAFLKSLADRKENRAPHLPTLAEYIELQNKQASNTRLPERARAKALERLKAAADLATFADKNGERYLMVEGKKVPLTGYSDRRREDLVPILETEKDVPILKELKLAGKTLSIPTMKERAGPPPTKEENDYHLQVERKNLELLPYSDEEKEDLKRVWNNRWAQARKLYKELYGEPKEGVFPVQPHPVASSQPTTRQSPSQAPAPAPQPPSNSVTREEVDELRTLIKAQQEEIRLLREQRK